MAKGTAIDFLLAQVRNSQTALVGGSVTFYSAGTSQLKAVFLDRDMTTQAVNPYNLDANGTAALFGIGLYRVVIRDVRGSIVYDRDSIYIGVDPDNLPAPTPVAQPNKNIANNGSFYMWNTPGGDAVTRDTIVDKECANGWFWTSDGSVAGTGVATKTAFTAGQTAVPDNPVYYCNLNRTVAVSGGATYERFVNRLPDVGRLSSTQLTITFYAKATGAPINANIFVRQDFGSGGSASPTPTTQAIVIPAGTWTRFDGVAPASFTLTIPSVDTKTIGTDSYTEIGLDLPVGTLFNIDIAHWQNEFGDEETQFEFLRSGEEYARTVGWDSGDLSVNTITLTQPDGVAPMTVASTTLVDNLNAEFLNSQTGAWYTPPGAVMAFAMNAAPSGWLKCNGQAISRSGIYTDLFTAIGTTYGTGNGSTTFNLPDLRGLFVRGWADDGTTYDTTRTFSSTVQADSNKNHIHTHNAHTHTLTDPGHAHTEQFVQGGVFANTNVGGSNATGAGVAGISTLSNTTGITAQNATTTQVADTAAEARPYNLALLYCIKY